jgi:hypothetical protein
MLTRFPIPVLSDTYFFLPPFFAFFFAAMDITSHQLLGLSQFARLIWVQIV